MTVENDVLMPTRSAVSHLRSLCPFDIPFAISAIRNFTDENLSTFSLTTSHPSLLFLLTVAYFVHTGLWDTVGVDVRELFLFLLCVRSHYNNVPYHNWFHALGSTHFVYTLYTTTRFDRFLTDLEVFALFLATICHDTDHDGLNNTFHRNARTKLARLAPNLPPLEHHHCCVSCDLMRPLLARLPERARATVTDFVIECIMATDMEQYKAHMEKWSSVLGRFDRADRSHRLLLAQIIIKAADLSNVAQKFDEAEQLSRLLIAEARRQGQIELALGLPVSPMCNPNDDTPLCVGQVRFYAFVARPLMKQLLAFFPEIAATVRQFEANLARWEEMKAAWEAAKGTQGRLR
jgi:cAMP-specific phosphodiesterase